MAKRHKGGLNIVDKYFMILLSGNILGLTLLLVALENCHLQTDPTLETYVDLQQQNTQFTLKDMCSRDIHVRRPITY